MTSFKKTLTFSVDFIGENLERHTVKAIDNYCGSPELEKNSTSRNPRLKYQNLIGEFIGEEIKYVKQ